MTRQTTSFALVIIAGVVVPVWFNPWAFDPFEIDKVMIARALGVASAMALITRGGMRWIRRFDIADPGYWLLMLAGWSALATVFSINPFRAMFGSMMRGGGLVTLACMVALYLGIRAAGRLTKRQELAIARATTASAIAIALLALLQYLNGTYLIAKIMPATTGAPFNLIRVAGTFGHPLYLAMYLVLMLPLVWHCLAHETHRSTRSLIIVGTVVMLVAIYLTRSRIALITVVALAGIYLCRKANARPRVIVCVGALAALAIAAIPSVRHTIARPESLYIRLEEWKFSAQETLKRPLFGYGFETYDHLSITRQRQPHELDDGIADRVHNIWLDTAHNAGIPAALMLAALLAVALARGITSTDPWHKTMAASLAMYVILMQTSFDNGFTYALIPVLLAQLSLPARHRETADITSLRPIAPPRLWAAGALGIILLAPIAANTLVYRASGYMAEGNITQEIKALRAARAFNPTWPELDMREAEAWRAAAILEPTHAQTHLLRAEHLTNLARKKGLPWYALPEIEHASE